MAQNAGEGCSQNMENETIEHDQEQDVKDYTAENIAGGKTSNGGEEVLEDVAEISSEEKLLTLQAELNQAKDQANDYLGRLQRLQAEFDNYRKRTLKEKEETVKYAAERLVEGLLPVLDNFERAISSTKANQDFASFSQGVEMISKQLQTLLVKEGLNAIEALGQPFDPNRHEAVLQVDSADHPEGTVLEELQKGYFLKEKLLRPSMVKVSR